MLEIFHLCLLWSPDQVALSFFIHPLHPPNPCFLPFPSIPFLLPVFSLLNPPSTKLTPTPFGYNHNCPEDGIHCCWGCGPHIPAATAKNHGTVVTKMAHSAAAMRQKRGRAFCSCVSSGFSGAA